LASTEHPSQWQGIPALGNNLWADRVRAPAAPFAGEPDLREQPSGQLWAFRFKLETLNARGQKAFQGLRPAGAISSPGVLP